MTKNDKVLLAAITIVTILSFLALYLLRLGKDKGQDKIALIKVKGKIVQEIQLSKVKEEITFSVDGLIGKTTIEVNKDKIRIVDAPCKDKICIHMSWAKRQGDSIICVPNQVVVEITGKKQDLDDITG